jgi:hypothetical protein
MADTLAALDQISEEVGKLSDVISAARTKTVHPSLLQPAARTIARTYFESVRPELSVIQNRAGLVEEIDFVLQSILQLATSSREKAAYLGQIAELRPYLLEATVDIMKARGSGVLVLSQIERAILGTLSKMLPPTAASYEQALLDIAQGRRVSWRGSATELREVLRETIDYLAPDNKVSESTGFQLEEGQTAPTQKQKVRFILRARRSNSAAVAVAEASLTTVEESVAALARSTYRRGSVSTHVATGATEIRNLKRYVDALLAELLEIQ